MGKINHLDHLITSQTFRFDRLAIGGIDNLSVLEINRSKMGEEETSLFHRNISSGDEYLEILHRFISESLTKGKAAPVVRFADGEYAFYLKNLHCNGLYQQAESVQAIEKAMPIHIEALNLLSQSGKIASLVHQGNTHLQKKSVFSLFRKRTNDDWALKFIDFLSIYDIELTCDNYIPFYVAYAYLTSNRFLKLMRDKQLCIVSSEYNPDLCRKWFAKVSSYPQITFIKIPDSYVATRWGAIKDDILERIPTDIDLCIVGAGIGSLLVCVDIAHKLSIPAIDAGHVLNMMNGSEEKSGGPRLFTIYKN